MNMRTSEQRRGRGHDKKDEEMNARTSEGGHLKRNETVKEDKRKRTKSGGDRGMVITRTRGLNQDEGLYENEDHYKKIRARTNELLDGRGRGRGHGQKDDTCDKLSL